MPFLKAGKEVKCVKIGLRGFFFSLVVVLLIVVVCSCVVFVVAAVSN